MAATLDDLLRREPGKLAHRGAVKRLRGRLIADREAAAEAMLADDAMRARLIDELQMMRSRVAGWRLADQGGIQLVEPALKRLYRQGRRRRKRAAGGSGDRTRTMHLWRKRVKDLRYAAEILGRPNERVGNGRKRKRAHKSDEAVRLGKVAAQAENLGEMLGEEHDLAVLAARVQAEARIGVASRGSDVRARKALLKAIARRRKRLRKRALRDGKRLYGQPPEKFVRRVRRIHTRASRV
jgi:hypothetical protein